MGFHNKLGKIVRMQIFGKAVYWERRIHSCDSGVGLGQCTKHWFHEGPAMFCCWWAHE